MYHCLSGIVVVGINRPKAKNAISKNLVKMVCIIFFPFFNICIIIKMIKPKTGFIREGQSRVSIPVWSRRFTLAGYCYFYAMLQAALLTFWCPVSLKLLY